MLVLWQAIGLLSTRFPPGRDIEFLVEEAMRGELWVHLSWTLRRAAIALVGGAGARRRDRLGDGLVVARRRVLPRRGDDHAGTARFHLGAARRDVVGLLGGRTDRRAHPGRHSDARRVDLRGRQVTAEAVDRDVLGLPRPEGAVFGWMMLPAMAPYIFAGFRYAVLAGWGALSLVEFFASNWGAGYRAAFWYDAGNFDGLMGWGLIEIVVILAVDRLVLERLASRSRRWQEGTERW